MADFFLFEVNVQHGGRGKRGGRGRGGKRAKGSSGHATEPHSPPPSSHTRRHSAGRPSGDQDAMLSRARGVVRMWKVALYDGLVDVVENAHGTHANLEGTADTIWTGDWKGDRFETRTTTIPDARLPEFLHCLRTGRERTAGAPASTHAPRGHSTHAAGTHKVHVAYKPDGNAHCWSHDRAVAAEKAKTIGGVAHTFTVPAFEGNALPDDAVPNRIVIKHAAKKPTAKKPKPTAKKKPTAKRKPKPTAKKKPTAKRKPKPTAKKPAEAKKPKATAKKPAKPRTEAQLAALAKGRAVRAANRIAGAPSKTKAPREPAPPNRSKRTTGKPASTAKPSARSTRDGPPTTRSRDVIDDKAVLRKVMANLKKKDPEGAAATHKTLKHIWLHGGREATLAWMHHHPELKSADIAFDDWLDHNTPEAMAFSEAA
jgi:outer membrane biosynthesis protein TonB